MVANMKVSPHQQIGELLEAVGSPVRVRILLAIGTGEVCVCHLESLLGLRQAYISQQLMDLREKGLIASRRDGKFIYYRLEKPEVLQLVHVAAGLAGIAENELLIRENSGCDCPKCRQVG